MGVMNIVEAIPLAQTQTNITVAITVNGKIAEIIAGSYREVNELLNMLAEGLMERFNT